MTDFSDAQLGLEPTFSGVLLSFPTKSDRLEGVAYLLKEHGIVVGKNDLNTLNLGDRTEYRAYLPVPGATTTRNKRLVATVTFVGSEYTITLAE